MQDFAVNAAVWIGPDFAQADRRAVDDMAPYEVDEASLAQFEALLPGGLGGPIEGSGADGETSGVGGVGAAGVAGSVAASVFATAAAQSEAGGRPHDERAVPADAIVSSYTIHHARLGVVHVQQSTGARGGAGTLSLRTDDAALRARLRDAMPALRGALTDGDGCGPDISVDV